MEGNDGFDIKKSKPHPFQRANFLSKIFFIWGFPLFFKGYKKELNEDDLYQPLNQLESKILGDKLEAQWKRQVASSKNPSLWRVILKAEYKALIILAVNALVNELLVRIAQPLLIGELLKYFNPTQNDYTLKDAYICAFLLIFSNILYIVLFHNYLLMALTVGQKLRIAVTALIYRKSLRLSKSALVGATVGQMVNLLANDTRRFEFLLIYSTTTWMAPLETLVVMYMLYVNLGYTAVVGTSVLLIFIPIEYYIGKKTSSYRLKTALKTDQRVKIMNEIISGIQIIKMYTWEKPFAFVVEQVRRSEIDKIRGVSYLRAVNFSFSTFLSRAAIFLCVITYVLTGNHLQAQYVFVATSFYTILQAVLTMHVPMMITHLVEADVSIKRIQKFLHYDEADIDEDPSPWFESSQRVSHNGQQVNGTVLRTIRKGQRDVGVSIEDASAKWLLSTENTLNNINFHAASGSLTAIVGAVGSGKTSLLHVILNELPIIRGALDVRGTLSYASQEPWLFSGSVRQNIIFGQAFDIVKYQEVIKICSLSHDLEKFPYGDQTLVGEKGVALSGGQKARINLARAIYRDADIYLLDDPLSAVDTHVGKQLFENCISDYLKDKCVILITHQVQYLKQVQKIYFLEFGEITVAGNYTDLQNSGKDFVKLFENHDQEIAEEPELTQKSLSLGKLNNVDKPKEVKEHMESGTIAFSNFINYFKAGGNCAVFFLIIMTFLLAQLTSSGADYFVTFWVNTEQDRLTRSLQANITENPTNETQTTISPIDETLTNFTNIVNDTVTITEIKQSFVDWFLTTENCIFIYTAIIISIIIMTLTRSISFYTFCMQASKNLHKNMFSKILNASMYFFNTNNSGRILNRFSKDMGAIDELLPSSFLDSLQIFLGVLASTFMITLVNPWIIIPTLVVFALFYYYRKIYMSTSRNLKRMEATTKSPIFGHLNASLQGLTTIRAMRAQKSLKAEFDRYQDINSSAYYMFIGCSRVFGYWLDLNCIFYTAIVIFSFLIMDTETYGGNVGLAITQSIALTGMLQWGMRQSSELENQVTSVERVLEYTNVTPEPDNAEQIPPKLWPQEGKIEFRNLSMRYSEDDRYVLKNLSFLIEAREKVGIVGRTGAGKSSLISALFRLAKNEGQILIDSIDVGKIPLNQLRSKISVIPQEPILFSGTLRKNLDPFDEFSDNDLWFGLEQVELKNVVSELPAGLNSTISEGGSNFSVGQRQLICLARAVIRHNKILVLDEATANVDPQTDELIQKTIRTRFSECTVLTVAHRLQTVMDSDKILVMSDGQAVEFDHPYNLLQNEDGHLYDLVQKTGKSMANQLMATAENTFREQVKNK